jgi:hypothetical protein
MAALPITVTMAHTWMQKMPTADDSTINRTDDYRVVVTTWAFDCFQHATDHAW